MTERAEQLRATVDQQICELIDFLSTCDEDALRLPCRGREKLGDGTIAAAARHVADNYQRIASIITTSDRMSAAHGSPKRAGHRVPRLLRALGHRPPDDHAQHDHDPGSHPNHYTADNLDLDGLLEQLSVTRNALQQVGGLPDSRLDTIPPNGSFRFCDGQRTLEQVLASLLKHQRHQLDALTTTT